MEMSQRSASIARFDVGEECEFMASPCAGKSI
jgi:hypothetical protein